MAKIIEKKVSVLERMMKDLVYIHTQNQIEFKEFKEEMKLYREKSDKEMKEFKDEMKEFKDEMKEFKKEINKKWSDLAKKLGTIAEDIVAPNITWIAQKYFNLKEDSLMEFHTRTKAVKETDKEQREFDAIAVYKDKVILNETKSTARIDYINDFIKFIESGEFYIYFPSYKNKKIIPIFSSLYIPENMIKLLTKNKIYAMAMKEDTMDILNYNEIK